MCLQQLLGQLSLPLAKADHFCKHWRGVKDNDTTMTNSMMRGAFLKDPNLRREFLTLLSKKNAS